MDVITQARELGKAIQQDDRYIAFMLIADKNEKDEELKAKIDKFNQMRAVLTQEAQKPDKDEKKMEELNTQFRDMYNEIVSSPNMVAFNAAKDELDKLINFVNTIISGACAGENPDVIEESVDCGGSCSSCAGCS